MTPSCRACWRNCALKADGEMVEIDALEDQIAPLEVKVSEIRDLISSFELCHHKAERWAENLVEAIGSGEADKGLGTRSPGVRHPVETVW